MSRFSFIRAAIEYSKRLYRSSLFVLRSLLGGTDNEETDNEQRMCGINAIYAFHPSAQPVDEEELLRTRECMRLRGPDAAGQWFSDDRRVALAHRRLSIIDVADRANQPMLGRQGDLAIVFNGEIYNYRVLR